MFQIFQQKSQEELPKTLGQAGELIAQKEYEQKGFELVASNFFNNRGLRLGEVDVIVKNKQKIIFVEVKTRKTEIGKFGTGAESVNTFKQIKLLKAVKVFLQQNPEYANLQPQIDVCLVGLVSVDKEPEYVKIISNAVEDWN